MQERQDDLQEMHYETHPPLGQERQSGEQTKTPVVRKMLLQVQEIAAARTKQGPVLAKQLGPQVE
jgi:hypothetical protein